MAIVILIIAFLVAIIAVVFALQNTVTVPVHFLFWQSEGTIALVLLITLALGSLVGLLVLSPALLKRRMEISKLKKNSAELEKTIEEQRLKIESLENQLSPPEEPLEVIVPSEVVEVIEPPAEEEPEIALPENDITIEGDD